MTDTDGVFACPGGAGDPSDDTPTVEGLIPVTHAHRTNTGLAVTVDPHVDRCLMFEPGATLTVNVPGADDITAPVIKTQIEYGVTLYLETDRRLEVGR